MSISFEGIGEVVATFMVEEGCMLETGRVVCLTGDGQVSLGESGGKFCGVVVSMSEDGYAGVQIDGMTQVGYTGSAPAVGWQTLAADGTGKAVVNENGINYLVAAVDETAQTAVIKL